MNIIFDKLPKTFGHNDLIIKLPNSHIIECVDTYYFAMDDNFMPEDGSQEKVIFILKFYLNLLIEKVLQLKTTEKPLLFPIDLSDEYIGFLIIEKIEKEHLLINYGLTREIRGYSYYPSKFEDFDQNINIDYAQCWNYKIKQTEFVENILNSIKNFE